MLSFFRRYQKAFFVVIAIVIIFSFSFFGTYSAFVHEKKVEPKKIAATSSGAWITDYDFYPLYHLLNYGQDCLASMKQNALPTLLNDGVFLKDFVNTGYAELLFDRFEEIFQEEILERIALAKNFKPFSHPKLSFLNQEEIWKSYAPSLHMHMKELKECASSDAKKGFRLLVALFADQQAFPAMTTERMISFQLNRHPDLAKEIDVSAKDFSLFGFHTLEDWFGRRFVSAVAWTIFNSAEVKKGEITLSQKEIEGQLIANLYEGFKLFTDEKNITQGLLSKAYQEELLKLGVERGALVKAWGAIERFRKSLKQRSDKVFVDPLAKESFYAYAGKGALVELYELPPDLQLKHFAEVASLDLYVNAALEKKAEASLFAPYKNVSIVKEQTPELAFCSYLVEWKEVDVEKLFSKISLKQLLKWQVEEANWKLLKSSFPYIVNTEAASEEERIAFLGNLSRPLKEKLESFVKPKIVEQHPEWIAAAFAEEIAKKEEVVIAFKGITHPFKGVKDPLDLMKICDQLTLSQESKEYSFDGRHFYQIRVEQSHSSPQVMTYPMAKKHKVLKGLVEKKLAEVYPEVRKKNAYHYQTKEGSWKGVEEVASDLYPIAFADLIKKLIVSAKRYDPHFSFDPLQMPLDLLAKYYFFDHVKAVQEDLTVNQEGHDFALVKQTQVLKRSSLLATKELLEKESGYLSPVALSAKGFGFMQVIGDAEEENSAQGSVDIRKVLCQEVEKREFIDMLNRIDKQQILKWKAL